MCGPYGTCSSSMMFPGLTSGAKFCRPWGTGREVSLRRREKERAHVFRGRGLWRASVGKRLTLPRCECNGGNYGWIVCCGFTLSLYSFQCICGLRFSCSDERMSIAMMFSYMRAIENLQLLGYISRLFRRHLVEGA